MDRYEEVRVVKVVGVFVGEVVHIVVVLLEAVVRIVTSIETRKATFYTVEEWSRTPRQSTNSSCVTSSRC